MAPFDQGAGIRGGVGGEADVIRREVLMRVSRTIQPDRTSVDPTTPDHQAVRVGHHRELAVGWMERLDLTPGEDAWA
jgi:hypothetical protein